MSVFERLKRVVKQWWFTPAVSVVAFIIQAAAPHLHIVKPLEAFLYPDGDWIGGVTIRLADVPGHSGGGSCDLVLVTHDLDDHRQLTFVSDGAAPREVSAGSTTRFVQMDQSKPVTSGISLFDAYAPRTALLAATVAGRPPGVPSRYYVVAQPITKELKTDGDLVVYTPNQLLQNRIAVGLIVVTTVIASGIMVLYKDMVPTPDD